MFMTAIRRRNDAETSVPAMPPIDFAVSISSLKAAAANAISMEPTQTIVEWPSEKKKPAAAGRFPSCMSLRVTLSIEAM